MIETSGHLPECDLAKQCRNNVAHDDSGYGDCLHCGQVCECDRLRACEARCDAKRHAEVKAWADLSRDNFDSGYAAGLSAARDAVAAVGVRKDTSYDMRVQALAAIDALRGEA